MLGDKMLKSFFAEKDLGILKDTKLAMAKPCALAAKKGNSILSSIRKSIISRLMEMLLPICSTLVRHM